MLVNCKTGAAVNPILADPATGAAMQLEAALPDDLACFVAGLEKGKARA